MKKTFSIYIGNESIVKIPEKTNAIGKFAFAGNTAVTEVILPNSVKKIEKGAFYNCPNLKRITAEGVKYVCESAFEDCTSLSEITFGTQLTKIKENAFTNCNEVAFIAPENTYADIYAKNNYIFCLHPENSEKKLTVSDIAKIAKAVKKIPPMLNLNKIIIGGSGTGKSRFYVKPNLMQLNTSFVITDPSGELLRDCGKMLERSGYKIKVFNIEKMEHSNNYNPFYYLREDLNNPSIIGNYKAEYVTKMINTFLMNTKGEGGSADPFWDNSTDIFLSAIIFLMLETADSDELLNWSTVLDLIHKAEIDKNNPKSKSELDLIFEKHAAEVDNALSIQSYTEFKQAAPETIQSILINTTARLKHFKNKSLRDLTSTDNIHLETLGDEKTALFIIIPSSDDTFTYLAAMMYTQLFDTLYSQAMHKYKGKLKVPVQFICDEFANTGKIPNFDKILATCRKFQISVDVILQNLSQLKRLYEKSWEELPGNCDTMIYLGGKDQSTNEFIMKELGKETIDTLSKNKSKGKQGSTSYNDGIMGRELMQLNELSTMDNNNCIVMIRGLNPFITSKFQIFNHPNYKMLYEGNQETESNFYSLEENINVEEEYIIVDTSNYYDSNTVIEADVITLELEFRSGNDKIETVSDLEKELGIDPDVSKMFNVA